MSQSTVGDTQSAGYRAAPPPASVQAARRAASRIPQVDYKRVFNVMERVDRARSLSEFKTQVVEALGSVMGFEDVSFFAGPTFRAVFSDPHPMVAGKTAVMLPPYQEGWFRHDMFGTPAAVRMFQVSGAASLSELQNSPAVKTVSSGYIRHFLHSDWSMESAAAVRIDLFGLHTGLIGIFAPDHHALGPAEMVTLRALSRQLSAVARGIPFVPLRHDCSQLTPRQRDVAHLLAEGFNNATIAETLSLAEESVKKYVSRVLATTGCATRMELALMIRSGPCPFGPTQVWHA
ncbi:response regulator transcription factor [Nocardioides sp. NPDC101246]|uniref:helix-turn-helix transcriptional regulator n=1 Tax=Nocardioides sp. NPDC101246 TaxID=3364336 RepID=UPI003814B596